MMDEQKKSEQTVIRNTFSVCPVCLKKLSAQLIQKEGGTIFLQKNCGEHGTFEIPVWKGYFDYCDWIRMEEPITETESDGCSCSCKSCGTQGQGVCCVILEVTKDCNLRCPFCFAYGGEHQTMPSTESLKQDIDRIVELAGDTLLQLSGGEPTLRDDLPELVAYAKAAGCSYTQINTNGIRLAEDEDYVRALAEAGLDIVFLQFDGTNDETFRWMRGKDLLDVKLRAIYNCDKYHIGVTLVPTIVKGVNDHQIGDVVRTAIRLFPAVKSIHFQPVTYLGRYPEDLLTGERYTLDELMQGLVEQTGIPENTLLPSRCDHAACEFHSTFVVSDEKHLIPVSDRTADARTNRTSAKKNREYVAEHWKRTDTDAHEDIGENQPIVFGKTDDLGFDTFLRYMKTRTLKISAMAFQDAMNLDLERLGRCSLHVYENGKLLPFCRKYLTPMLQSDEEIKELCDGLCE